MEHWTNPRGRMPTGCGVVVIGVVLAGAVGVILVARHIFGW